MNWLAVQREATEGERGYTMPERLFCLAIASRMGNKPEAWPSLGTISRFAGSSVATMTRASRRPCDAEGIFIRSLRPGRAGSCSYRVRPEIVAKWADGNHAQDEQGNRGSHAQDEQGKAGTMLNLSSKHAQDEQRITKELPNSSSAGNHAQFEQGKNGTATWLVQARAAWQEAIGDPPIWFADDLRKLVTGSRTGADILEGLRLYLDSADLQKPGAELLRGFRQNAAEWCAKAKREPKPHRETPEERRARAALYGIELPA